MSSFDKSQRTKKRKRKMMAKKMTMGTTRTTTATRSSRWRCEFTVSQAVGGRNRGDPGAGRPQYVARSLSGGRDQLDMRVHIYFGTLPYPAAIFFTRWITHFCAISAGQPSPKFPQTTDGSLAGPADGDLVAPCATRLLRCHINIHRTTLAGPKTMPR